MGRPPSPAESALAGWHWFETLRGLTRDWVSERETFAAPLRDGPWAVLK
jgi:hypothetical protein